VVEQGTEVGGRLPANAFMTLDPYAVFMLTPYNVALSQAYVHFPYVSRVRFPVTGKLQHFRSDRKKTVVEPTLRIASILPKVTSSSS